MKYEIIVHTDARSALDAILNLHEDPDACTTVRVHPVPEDHNPYPQSFNPMIEGVPV